MSVDMNNFRHPSVFLKGIEILLLIVVMCTFYSVNSWPHGAFYVSGCILASFINALVLMCLYLVGYTQIQKTPLEMILYVYYILGFFASAIILMAHKLNSGSLIASGIFCLFLVLVYGVDLYFSYMNLAATFPNQTPQLATANTPVTIDNIPVTIDPGTLANETHQTQSPTYSTYPSTQFQSVYTVPYVQPAGGDTGVMAMGNASSRYSTNPQYPHTLDYPPSSIKTSPFESEVMSSHPKV